MSEKVLTVSVAAYNVENYLADALESCLSVIDDLDIIVVNDGSSDGTLAVAREWETKYPNSIRIIDKVNGGYGSTINASIPLARGKYFRYLDGDDWFDEECLSDYVRVLGNSREDAVVTPFKEVYENGADSRMRDCLSFLREDSYEVDSLDSAWEIGACCIAYRTDLIKDSGFSMTERCFYTDLEYAFIPMVKVRTLRVLHNAVYLYRIGREGQSISIDGLRKHYSDIIRVRARLLREIGEKDCLASEYLQGCLVRECCAAYRFLCLCGPDSGIKTELRSFDTLIKRDYPDLYLRMSKSSKRVALLRLTRFLAWGYACKEARKGV